MECKSWRGYRKPELRANVATHESRASHATPVDVVARGALRTSSITARAFSVLIEPHEIFAQSPQQETNNTQWQPRARCFPRTVRFDAPSSLAADSADS